MRGSFSVGIPRQLLRSLAVPYFPRFSHLTSWPSESGMKTGVHRRSGSPGWSPGRSVRDKAQEAGNEASRWVMSRSTFLKLIRIAETQRNIICHMYFMYIQQKHILYV